MQTLKGENLGISFETFTEALARLSRWVECPPVNQEVTGQSCHMPRLQAQSPVGFAQEAPDPWFSFTLDVSILLSLSLPLSKINSTIKTQTKRKEKKHSKVKKRNFIYDNYLGLSRRNKK